MKRNIVWVLALMLAACVATTTAPPLPTESEAYDQLSELVKGDVTPPPGGGSVVSLQALVEVTRACQPIWPDLINVYNTPDDTTTASWAAVALACSNIWPSLIEVLHSPGFGWITTPVQPTPRLLSSVDFVKIGSFRLPNQSDFTYCGERGGLSGYRADGDPNNTDSYPGSLYGVGHAQRTPIFEVAIPTPISSNVYSQLPVAQVLQLPLNIRNTPVIGDNYIRGVHHYNGYLYIAFGQHFEYNRRAGHARMDENLTNLVGAWYIGTGQQVSHINTDDYYFEIPSQWSDQHVPGMKLVCGRYRRGQQAGGPPIIAFKQPEGAPPPDGIVIEATPLLLYDWVDSPRVMNGHCKADTWTGGAWITTPDNRSAVVIIGRKGIGNCYYYFGTDGRGYRADDYETQILFYDPDDLAAVAAGQMETWEPQPYEVFNITDWMIRNDPDYGNRLKTGGISYDRTRNLLYITEAGAIGSPQRPAIHVVKIQ